jgi:hypothetical protein
MQIMRFQKIKIIYLESAFGLVLYDLETRGLLYKMLKDANYANLFP